MDLTHVDRQRSGLVQFCVVLMMIFLALIMAISWTQQRGLAIPALTVLSLIACLYVIGRERSLKDLQSQLLDEIVRNKAQVGHLGRKLKDEELRIQTFAGLYRAISSLSSVDDSRRTYETVLRSALELVGGNCGAIAVLDESYKVLRFRCTTGLDSGVASLSLQPGHGMAGWVVEHGEPLLLDDDPGDPRRQDPVARRAESTIALAVPLRMEGKVKGSLSLGSTDAEARAGFSEGHLRNAYLFAHHAALALELAELKEVKRVAATA